MNLYLIEWTDNNYLFYEYPNNNYIHSYKQLKLDDLSIAELEEIKESGYYYKSDTIFIYDIDKDWVNYINTGLLFSNIFSSKKVRRNTSFVYTGLLLDAICMIKEAERYNKIDLLL